MTKNIKNHILPIIYKKPGFWWSCGEEWGEDPLPPARHRHYTPRDPQGTPKRPQKTTRGNKSFQPAAVANGNETAQTYIPRGLAIAHFVGACSAEFTLVCFGVGMLKIKKSI